MKHAYSTIDWFICAVSITRKATYQEDFVSTDSVRIPIAENKHLRFKWEIVYEINCATAELLFGS